MHWVLSLLSIPFFPCPSSCLVASLCHSFSLKSSRKAVFSRCLLKKRLSGEKAEYLIFYLFPRILFLSFFYTTTLNFLGPFFLFAVKFYLLKTKEKKNEKKKTHLWSDNLYCVIVQLWFESIVYERSLSDIFSNS